MFDWNRWLFSRLAAGHGTDAPLIPAARWMAEHGATIGILMLLVLWWLRPTQRAGVCGVGLLAALAAAVAHALADAIAMPRPFVTGDSAPWIAHGGRGAFPSAHATVMFAAALGLWQLRGMGAAALAMAALGLATAWARVHGGLHYPMDILGGAGVAAVLVYGLRFMAVWLGQRWAAPRGRLARRLLLRRWRASTAGWPLRRPS
ncbi:MAG: phosphatase PAP2 family protein [Pseudomonadota bacterium]|nr:phosphatase PAP2 family protein [Pseudomonadota bacterium]